jgi:hypothetical protein
MIEYLPFSTAVSVARGYCWDIGSFNQAIEVHRVYFLRLLLPPANRHFRYWQSLDILERSQYTFSNPRPVNP